MNLRTRVDALYARLRPSRLVIVWSGDGPSVVAMPEGRGLVLTVPDDGEFLADPATRLTATQRALIASNDQVILVSYADRTIQGGPDGSDSD